MGRNKDEKMRKKILEFINSWCKKYGESFMIFLPIFFNFEIGIQFGNKTKEQKAKRKRKRSGKLPISENPIPLS